ncbi:ATP-dependent DNA ligase [Scheffersomyces amazonensis]|uniref:ATP-dependent DNA ligase n=1 Tax=Scheffersomyces amazonensis TaxID=1078765 RepID=UPI00315CC8D9
MAPQQQSIARFFGGGASKSKPQVEISKSGKHPLSPSDKSNSSTSSPVSKKQKLESSTETSSIDLKVDTDPSESEDTIDKDIKSPIQQANELIKLTKKEHEKHKGEVLGANIPYARLTEVFDKIENESSRLKIISIVSEFFLEILQQSSVDKLVKIVYLFINRLGPDYEPDLELGLGESLLIRAISECSGRASSKVKKDYQEVGDLGKVAQKSKSAQPTMFKPKSLDIDMVFTNLTQIAKSTGKDSVSKKVGIINKMLTACDAKTSEAKFLIRSLEGKLRIGLAEKTVLIGLAQAFLLFESNSNRKINPEKLNEVEDIIREAFSRIPNYEIIIQAAYDHGIENILEYCQLTPGIPLKPMLAKPTKSITEVLDRFQGEEFTCEYKYDGERAQVHLLSDGTIKIYSRNSEDMSQRYPDLIPILREVMHSKSTTSAVSMVLDCEAVAWDRINNKILPFQVLSTRKRKDVDEKDIKVHICLFAFDLLYYNNEALITHSLTDRRSIMHENLTTIEGKFQFATAKNSSNLDELQVFLDQSVKDACEGLMVKMLNGKDSFYEPSKRSRNWLKLKKDYLEGVGDSLDLVVIGGYIGRGKRTGSYGGFLLASYNEDTGEYETTCKIGTGFSDEDLSSIHAKLKPTEIKMPKPFYVYDTTNSNAIPDVWFEPTTVFEVLAADFSLSPIYKAAHQEYGKGISLRFPRFLRIRDDKGIEDATSSTQVSEFYRSQANINI